MDRQAKQCGGEQIEQYRGEWVARQNGEKGEEVWESRQERERAVGGQGVEVSVGE